MELISSNVDYNTFYGSGTGSSIKMDINGISSSTYISDYPKVSDSESDHFKKIVSLLGIKIINVSFNKDKITLCGKRNKSKFTIEISYQEMIVKTEKGDIIASFFLESPAYTYYPGDLSTGTYKTTNPTTTTTNISDVKGYTIAGTITDRTALSHWSA